MEINGGYTLIWPANFKQVLHKKKKEKENHENKKAFKKTGIKQKDHCKFEE
jgi:hypothetical protein